MVFLYGNPFFNICILSSILLQYRRRNARQSTYWKTAKALSNHAGCQCRSGTIQHRLTWRIMQNCINDLWNIDLKFGWNLMLTETNIHCYKIHLPYLREISPPFMLMMQSALLFHHNLYTCGSDLNSSRLSSLQHPYNTCGSYNKIRSFTK